MKDPAKSGRKETDREPRTWENFPSRLALQRAPPSCAGETRRGLSWARPRQRQLEAAQLGSVLPSYAGCGAMQPLLF